MKLSKLQLWERFQKYFSEFPTLGLTLDLSRMSFSEEFLPSMESRIQKAFADMAALEKGAIANPDEGRMVGHYWLRNPALAPSADIRREIEETIAAIQSFAARVHDGSIRGAGGPFKNLLLIGIGGSALGPQFVSHALSQPTRDKLRLFTLDNTDPDGMDRVFETIGDAFGQTLCVVISKSGGTKETRNGMLETQTVYERAGLNFGNHAVAVTQAGSQLDKYAANHGWLKRFPMWDWVGGRTSELSAVGLLPAALQGFDIESLLAGARACDICTRSANVKENPSAQLALMWHHSGNGIGSKNMVVLPYKDRLEPLSRYLQQLIMESIGKEKDLSGQQVNQGLTVLGNKGSTDQHAFVQQLMDGRHDFFVTFIQVLKHRNTAPVEVEPDVTSGDHLLGFLLGTRRALTERGRQSLTISVESVSPFSIGVLIALFERAVGFYASLVNINAYHQPGVEAGKLASSAVIELQAKVLGALNGKRGSELTAASIAESIGQPEEIETVLKICESLTANPHRGVVRVPKASPLEAAYRRV